MNPQIAEPGEGDRRELRVRVAWDLHAEIKGYADRAGVPLSSFAAGLLALGLGRWESGEFSTEYGKDPDARLLITKTPQFADHDRALTVEPAGLDPTVVAENYEKAVVSAADEAIRLNQAVRYEVVRMIRAGRLVPVAGDPLEQYVTRDIDETTHSDPTVRLPAKLAKLTAAQEVGPGVTEEDENRQARRVDLAKKAVADKGLKLNDTAYRHAHKPGEVLDTYWEKGTRFVQYSCVDDTCDETINRRA